MIFQFALFQELAFIYWLGMTRYFPGTSN
jgi:hypothetical protein